MPTAKAAPYDDVNSFTYLLFSLIVVYDVTVTCQLSKSVVLILRLLLTGSHPPWHVKRSCKPNSSHIALFSCHVNVCLVMSLFAPNCNYLF